MAGWFRTTASGSSAYQIFGLSGYHNAVYIDSLNRPTVEMWTTPYTHTGIAGSTVLSVNKWYFIAVSVDTAGKTMNLYIDGKLISNVTLPTGNIHPYSQFFIGAFPITAYTTPQFEGNLDKVGLYKKALGLAEIQNIYLAEKDYFLARK